MKIYRIDPPWGKINDVRLAKLIPGRRIVKPGTVAAQFGYTVNFPSESIKESSIRIKNFGFLKKESRESKKEFFNKLGIKINNQAIVDWEYITSYKNISLFNWVEDNTVTFYTPVNKGSILLYNWLEKNAYFADVLVIGNDSNQLNENDLKLCSRYGGKVVNIKMGDNFAEGRNDCLKQCTSDYIFQLDIDERIEDFMAWHSEYGWGAGARLSW